MFEKPPSRRRPMQGTGAPRREPRLSRDPAEPDEPRRDGPASRFDPPQREWNDDLDRAEPSLWREPRVGAERASAAPRLRLAAEREPFDARSEKDEGWSDFRRSRRRPALWLVGGTLLLAAASIFAYSRQGYEPTSVTRVTQSPPEASLRATGLQPALSLPAPTTVPAPQATDNAMPVSAPQRIATTPAAPPQGTPSNLIAPPRAATILPPISAPPEEPQQSVAAAKPPAPLATKPAPKAPREAEAAPKPSPAAPAPPRDLAQRPSGDQGDHATVAVDGTQYVAGREPHTLGSLSTQAELASAPAAASPAAPQAASASAPDKPDDRPLPPNTDFAITPGGIMTPSGVVTPFGQQ